MLLLDSMAGWKLKDELLSPETDMETCVVLQPVYVLKCYSTERVFVIFRALMSTAKDALVNQDSVFS